MTWEERLYDHQIDEAWPQKPSARETCCPECGAVLDSDEDELYESREGDYILGCSRCVQVRPAGEKEWEE
ncbi:hypothetical protein [Pygmaiobacter massiliensis]|uniref:hypothetical protein n=1 Tax=Pygmaiobacter massiliensis TaxID=1917873 RepID=UPI000C79B4CD|nr:hypothetical protein [Pygmaiobacter massiliensis]MDY4784714.1 hypothetical protein [Pygmaiobacter massiliensis]